MIIGKPYSFALFIDVVKDWNLDNSFNNGILFININQTIFPNKLIDATLNTELCELIDNFEHIKENNDLFMMEKNKAFECIYKLTFPDNYDIDNDYSYNVTPFALWDNDYFVFMVSSGKKIRILSSELTYSKEKSVHDLIGIEVIETFISVDELQDIVQELRAFQFKIRSME